jgi:hypothetical protein
MSKLQTIFTMFFHIMVKYNPKKGKEQIIFKKNYGGSEYICMKKIQIYFKNIEMVFIFHEIYNSYFTCHLT